MRGEISRVESNTKNPEGTSRRHNHERRRERPNAQKRLVVRGPGWGPGSGVRVILALGSRGPGQFVAGVAGARVLVGLAVGLAL